MRGPVLYTAACAVARPDHDIGSFGGVQQGGQVGRIVRKVGIHLNNAVGSEREGALKAVAVRPPQATRPFTSYHAKMGEFRAAVEKFLGAVGSSIGRMVVHQQQMRVGQHACYLRGEQRHILHFVVRRHDNHAFHQDYGFLFACCLYCTPCGKKKSGRGKPKSRVRLLILRVTSAVTSARCRRWESNPHRVAPNGF